MLDYNNQRVCGLWLSYIGIIIILSAFSGGKLLIQPFLIGFGYVIGYIIIFILPYINQKLSYGKNTRFQDRMDNISLLFLVVFSTLCGLLIGVSDLRLLWLSIFLVVGIHFFGFYFSQGKLLIWLGLLTVANAVLGLILINTPFIIFAIIDGLLKISFGIKMLQMRRAIS